MQEQQLILFSVPYFSLLQEIGDILSFMTLFSLYFTNQQTPLLSAVPRPEEAEEIEAEVLPKTTTRALMDVGIFTEAIPETVR